MRNYLRSSKEPVTPRECILLFGLPLTKDAFLRKIDGPRDGNFAEGFRASSTELSWAGYSATARRLCFTAEEAERLGVRVVREMQLPDILSACRYKAITIISHWRSAKFREADICDAGRILGAIDGVSNERVLLDNAALAGYLNRRLTAGLPTEEEGLGAVVRLQKELLARREAITSQIPDAFRGGAGVEFRDGFHGAAEIREYVSPSFTGVFDLTVCNSLLLAEALHERCQHSLVLCNTDVTFPEMRLPFYRAIIQLLATRPFAYEDAVNELHRELRRRFQ